MTGNCIGILPEAWLDLMLEKYHGDCYCNFFSKWKLFLHFHFKFLLCSIGFNEMSLLLSPFVVLLHPGNS